MKKLIGGMFCMFLGGFGLAATSVVLRGIVLVKLWQWFLVAPLGAPAISIPVAIGISMISSHLVPLHLLKKENNAESVQELGKNFGMTILTPLFGLLFGYVVKLFI